MSKINYEFHITVIDADKDPFISFCSRIGVKPILLELQDSENIVLLHDVMTSHHSEFNSDELAMIELKRVSSLLQNAGFNVVREKIEADINHPDVIKNKEISTCPNYFETHFNILISENEEDTLRAIAAKNDCHFSRNIFKKIENEYTIMITKRVYSGTGDEFKSIVAEIEEELTKSNLRIEKTIIEYAIFDTKEDWDSEWLNSTQE